MRLGPRFPVIAASGAALLMVVAALLVFVAAPGLRGDAATVADGNDIAPIETAIADESPVGREADALKRGRELLIPPGERGAAPEFAVQTASFGDGTVFAAPVAGAPATIVFFMAASCFTCPPEAKALARIHERYASDGVLVLTMDVDPSEGEPELAAFRERTGQGGHLWALDRGFVVARALEVNRLSATVVIDREGRIAYRDGGPTDYNYLSAIV